MIKFQSKCVVCQAIKKDKSLAEAIYKTTAYDKTSNVPLKTFWRMHSDKFGYESLRNHVKKHQAITAEALNEQHLKGIVKKAEKDLLRKKVESKEIWDSVMEMGLADLKDGKAKVQVGDMLRAAKDKSDYDLKVKDQEIAMIEMVYHFASGEDHTPKSKIKGIVIDAEPVRDDAPTQEGEHHHLAEEFAGSPEEGAERSSTVHYPPTWDAPTFGSG